MGAIAVPMSGGQLILAWPSAAFNPTGFGHTRGRPRPAP
jgi:hypothetical protein